MYYCYKSDIWLQIMCYMKHFACIRNMTITDYTFASQFSRQNTGWAEPVNDLRQKSKFSIIDKYSAFIQVKSRENMHSKNTDANQTTHLHNLISVIVIRCLDTWTIIVSLATYKNKISS